MIPLAVGRVARRLGAAGPVDPRARALLLGTATVVAVVVAWGMVDALAARPVPAGVMVEGVVQGALVSFTAMGLVLVYRAARFLNFSQAAIGGIAASVVELAVLGWHLDFWLALVIGLAAAALVGAAVDATVVRRLRGAPRLVVTVGTIGLLQILSVANGYLPDLAGKISLATTFNVPLGGSYSITGVAFSGDDTAAMVAVPLVLAALWWFLARTETGTAVRAVADSPERAGLLGIPVRRVSRVVWVVAAVLSGIGTVLTSTINHPPLGVPLTPEDLFPALAAFVLAGFDSLPAAVAWSLVVGVIDDAVYWVYQNGTYAEVAVFVLVVVGVAVQRRRATRVDDGGLGDFVAAREVAPIPAAVAALPEIRWGRRVLTVGALAAAVLVPLALSPTDLDLVTSVPVYAILGLSLVVLTGWAGQISLGQFAFGGIGAIVTGVLMVHAGVDLFVALAAAVAACAALAALVGSSTMRLPGLALAAVTMAFAVAVSDWLLSSYYFPFLNPQQVPRPVLFGRFPMGPDSPLAFYELCLALLVVALLVVRNVRRSRTGRAIMAVRDNARGAAAYALDPARTRMVALAVAGGLAGLAGGLYLVQLGGLGSGGLTASDSVTVFIMVVIGGLTSPLGAVAGAVVFECILYFISPGLQQLATGAGVLVFLLFLPEGIGGTTLRLREMVVTAVARRRGITVGPLARVDAGAAPLPGAGPTSSPGAVPVELVADPPVADLVAADPPGTDQLSTALAAAGFATAPAAARTADGRAGPSPSSRLVARAVDVAIGQTPIVSGVDIEVAPGTVTALLGTNGAGKSTTLRALAGALPLRRGTLLLDGVDISAAPIDERVRRGLVLVPGGRGVFPSLSVDDNLRLAGWTARRSPGGATALADAMARVRRLFPRLAERGAVSAGMLSGGEQQMLTLAQGLLCRPSVLLIDELSLGLAPTVVAELLRVVEQLAAGGVAVVLVEQSVNIAAAIADEALFMERGQVRYRGATADLARRSDLVRSVFLGGPAGGPPADAVVGATGTGSRPADRRAAPGGPVVAGGVGRAVGPATAGGADGAVAPGGGEAEPVAALRLVGLSKFFGGVAAVGDVSLSVAPGEIVGVIGANGAGKTTVLDMVSGFVTPDRGRVLLGGVDVTAEPAAARARRGLGRVFQDARLFPSLTVAQVLATALERRVPLPDPFLSLWWTADVRFSEEEVAARAHDLLVSVGLLELQDRFVSQLSTGTRRVVELACAMAHDPDVLLLDEPSAGLAQRECEALAGHLRQLRQATGAGFLVVEHDVPLLAQLADRLVCLHLGRVIAEGPSEQVLADPQVLDAYLGTDAVAVGRSGPVAASLP